jgi:amino acid transporter
VENIVWFPSILTFVATSFAAALAGFAPDLAANKTFLLAVMLIVLWALTVVNLRGLRATSILERVGVIAGTMIPQIALVLLGLGWVLGGQPSQIPWSAGAMRLDINLNTLPMVSTVILLFAGMEISGYHALETRDPQRDYPRAMFLGAAMIFSFSVLSTLAIAMVVPLSQLSISSGLMQAFYGFLAPFGLAGLLPIFALLAALGACATLTTWMLGPAKGIGVAARLGDLPEFFGRENQSGVPANTILLQAAGSSLFVLLIMLVPSINSAYWIFSALTTQVLATMYLIMFAAALGLRYSKPDAPRAYRVPGGRWGIWVACGAGFLSCLFVLVIGFLPPGQSKGEALSYAASMLIGYCILVCPPILLWLFRRPGRAQPVPATAGAV